MVCASRYWLGREPSSAQPLQAQPSTPLFIPPAQPQPLHPPNAATPPPTQSPPTQSSPVLVTPPAPQASECSAPQPKENLSEKDVLPPSSDPIMAENAEGQETVQKKKKPKKPKKKENEVPGVIFLDDSEKKQKDPNNAVGQFVDETEEEDKKKKKAPRDSRRLQRAPTPRGSRGEPKTDASFRQKRPSASAASGRLALVKPPPQQVQKVQPAAAEVLAKGDKAAKEPNEGFFKAMYYKARQKISQMHKNPNAPASAAPNTSGDDTLVVTEATVIKTDVSAVYGQAHDYPKGIVPPKTDKNHPERLFPGGRPYWLIRDEKPPQAKVIMMGLVDQCIKDGTLKLVQQQTRP
uniref:Uncharacterized protein n=1 Tax=Caenorhabditis japonica TaxID=281687 RepID=A0A8R1I1P1_CAEJA